MSVSTSQMIEAALSKHSSSLLSEDKKKRILAIEELKSVIFEKESGLAMAEKVDHVYKHILRCFSDKAEAVRESAINLVIKVIELMPVREGNHYMLYLMPVLNQRLSSPEIVEPSEEVRLSLVLLLNVLIQKYHSQLASFMDDMIRILAQTLVDPYPTIKKESCDCVSKLAKAVPQHFHQQSETLVKPLLQSFNHQHYKLRVAAINSIGDLMRYGNSKCMDQVSGPLAERLFDQTSMVRQAVIQVVGTWLLHLPDRYSYFPKLLPLLLTGLSDELPLISTQAGELWEAAGRQYMVENESDLKDQMDFLLEQPEHYPPGLSRPNLGCRTLVSRHMCQIVGPLVRELSDWLPDVRVKSAQLLCLLTLNAEANMTHHVEKMLPGMYRAACDEDPRVVINIEKAAQYIGYFVPCDTCCQLLLPTLEPGELNAGHLRVLAGILRGSQLKLLLPNIEQIANFLARSDVRVSYDHGYQLQLLACCESLLSVGKKDCSIISQPLFVITVTTMALASNEVVAARSRDVMSTLCKLTGVTELYSRHMPDLLQQVNSSVDSWTITNADRLIFETLVIQSGSSVGLCLDIILPTLAAVVRREKEPEVRLKSFTVLSALLAKKEETFQLINNPQERLHFIITDIISPCLVWHAGRTAEAIRTAALCCLSTALDMGAGDDFAVAPLVPLTVALVADPARRSRQFALKVIGQLANHMQARDALSADSLHQMYPEVLKRLDDVEDDVRLSSVRTLVTLFKTLPLNYSLECCRSHWDALFNTMMIHLDDSNPTFQTVMLDALKSIGLRNPKLLLDKVVTSKQNFRNQQACYDLENFLRDKTDDTISP